MAKGTDKFAPAIRVTDLTTLLTCTDLRTFRIGDARAPSIVTTNELSAEPDGSGLSLFGEALTRNQSKSQDSTSFSKEKKLKQALARGHCLGTPGVRVQEPASLSKEKLGKNQLGSVKTEDATAPPKR